MLPNRPTPPGLESNSPSLQRSQGGSLSRFARRLDVALMATIAVTRVTVTEFAITSGAFAVRMP